MSVRRVIVALLGTLGVVLAFVMIPAVAEAGTPHWQVVTRTAPSELEPGQEAAITSIITNLGDAPVIATTANPVRIKETLPIGVNPTSGLKGSPSAGSSTGQIPLNCKPLPELECSYVGEIPAGISLSVIAGVRAESTFSEGKNELEVTGANVPTPVDVRVIKASASPTQFGVERYEVQPEEENGTPDLRGGSHPYQLTTTLELNQTLKTILGIPAPSEPLLLRNVDTTLPPGLIGNPLVVPTCSLGDFSTIRLGPSNLCPEDTAVGVAALTFKEPSLTGWRTENVPVFNLEPGVGEPARFGFEFATVLVTLDTGVQTGNGYAVEVNVSNVAQAAEVLGTTVTIWGVPSDPSHDSARGWECLGNGVWVNSLHPQPKCQPTTESNAPAYLTLPTTCEAPLRSYVQVQSWEESKPLAPVAAPEQKLAGCGSLPFEPTVNVTPDEKTASTPSGYNVEVKLPQSTTLSSSQGAEADVRATELAFPEGVQTNAGGADGLGTCSVGATGFLGRLAPEGTVVGSFGGIGEGEQQGLEHDNAAALEADLGRQTFTGGEATCPDASKIGEVSIRTPVLEDELKGGVYLGGQDTDPFLSPLVLYVIAEDKKSGVRVKLAGETRIGPTGQLTSVFRDTPPVPFETLKLHLTDGARASLTTPSYCRSYESVATFTPWSGGEQARATSSFAPQAGPNGGPCQSGGPLPFEPTVKAGATNPQASAFTSFTTTIGHPDGQQPLKQITIKLPEGLAGVLANVTQCPSQTAEAQVREFAEGRARQSAQCPESSSVGASTAFAGLGSDTVSLPGKLYLTAGIKGAPFGLLDVTEAKAGPFDLGEVPVASTITINETTAAVTVTSDPLPEYVKGVPSQVKALTVNVDRPGFQFNPSNCTPTAVGGTLTGYEGGSYTVSAPFGVSNCANLPFGPKLTASVDSKASKVNGVGFRVTIESPGLGQANIHKVELELPEALPSRNTTLQKACLEKVFNENPAGCPEGATIGYATVHTPVLKNPLTGPAILVSHGNAAFPDVEFLLQGEGIKLLLDGKTDIKKVNGAEVTFSRFETSPDAPFTKFETVLPAGPHSILTSFVPKDEYNLCAATNLKMPTTIVGQNGAVIEQTTNIVPSGCALVKGATANSKLTAALKKCKKDKKKKKRTACEAAARKKYGAKAARKAPRHAAKKPARSTKAH